MRDFCKPFVLTEEQRNRIGDELAKFSKMEITYNCHGDCLMYLDGVLVAKEKKDGTIINYETTNGNTRRTDNVSKEE